MPLPNVYSIALTKMIIPLTRLKVTRKKCSLQKPNVLQYQDQNRVLKNIHSSQTVQFPGLYSQAEAPPPHPNWIQCCSLHPQEQMSTGLLMQVHLTPSIGSTWVVRKAVPVSVCSPTCQMSTQLGFFFSPFHYLKIHSNLGHTNLTCHILSQQDTQEMTTIKPNSNFFN